MLWEKHCFCYQAAVCYAGDKDLKRSGCVAGIVAGHRYKRVACKQANYLHNSAISCDDKAL